MALLPRRRTAWCPATAAKSWCRAKRHRSTSIPGPASARGVSAAEPERQPAVGRERLAGCARRRRAANGTLPNNEPRKIKTLAVKGDAAENGGVPAGATLRPKPAPATRSAAPRLRLPLPAAAAAPRPAAPRARNPSSANASANAPLSLTPQGGAAPAGGPGRVAAINPAQAAPATNGGGYLVQVSSQKNEADAQASYRALQGKFPAVLGSRSPVIKRADLGEKGVYYRAMVGPFGSPDEARSSAAI